MTLTEWERISLRSRIKLILTWYRTNRSELYERLAIKAAAQFERNLGVIQEVTDVETECGNEVAKMRNTHICEIVLVVRTVLPATTVLAKIPKEFKGFRVKVRHLGDLRDSFLRTWKRLFHELLGWSDSRTIEWAKECTEGTKGQLRTAVYHYGPIKTALPTVIREKTKKGSKVNPKLYDEVLRTILYGAGCEPTDFPDTMQDYDWKLVRRTINCLVRKYST